MAKVNKEKSKGTLEKKESLAGFLFTLPWFIGLLYFFIYPFALDIFYSFNEVKFDGGEMQYSPIGWSNYYSVFTSSPDFIRGFFESIGTIFIDTVLIIFFSIFIALILKSEFRGRTFVRAVFFLPVIIASGPIISIINGDSIAQELLSGGRTSMLFDVSSMQDILLGMGLPYKVIEFFLGIINDIFNLSWRSGIQILLFLAGLQGVPSHLYEAAEVEGATKWESFWRITFPMITPILLLNVVYTLIEGFTDFNNTIISSIVSFTRNLNLSYGAALGVCYFFIIAIIIAIVYLALNRKTFYVEK